MNKKREALKQAYVACLRSSAAVLAAWREVLPSEHRQKLAEFEEKGLRVGLSLSIPKDVWVLAVTLHDPAGGVVTLATIEPSAPDVAPLTVN